MRFGPGWWDTIPPTRAAGAAARRTTRGDGRRGRLSPILGWLGVAVAGTSGLVSDWDEIAERHFPAFRARPTTFQGQRRLRLRDFPPRVGIDASGWSDERLDGVFEGGDQRQQEDKVPHTGLGRYIDIVLTSDELGLAKPDPRIFELACRRFGVPPHAAVYVGDRLEVDALAAKAAGLSGIWLNRKGGAAPPGVEVIDDLAELPSPLGAARGT